MVYSRIQGIYSHLAYKWLAVKILNRKQGSFGIGAYSRSSGIYSHLAYNPATGSKILNRKQEFLMLVLILIRNPNRAAFPWLRQGGQ